MSIVPKNRYVGRRYVPLQCGDWDKNKDYESLSVVQWGGASYTSKQDVPKGIEITNADFWVRSADYNAQVETYRQEILTKTNTIQQNFDDWNLDFNEKYNNFNDNVQTKTDEFDQLIQNKADTFYNDMEQKTTDLTTIAENKVKELKGLYKSVRLTYSELKTLKDNNELNMETKYIITDYKTKYQQPTTEVIKEMETEELILVATSDHSFSPIVFSPSFPQDIIVYDFDNDKCEDGTTPRNGFILRRNDTKLNINIPQDWRTMLWARYTPDENQYYYDGTLTDYSVWSSGNAEEGKLYKANDGLYIAKNSNVPSSNTDISTFDKYYELSGIFLINDKLKIADKIELKKGILREVKTIRDYTNNHDIFIDDINRLHNNTFEKNCYNNTFGNGCNNNTFGNDCYGNTFGKFCYSNTFVNFCHDNTFGNDCYGNTFERCFYNTFGTDCNRNTFRTQCDRNTFGIGCSNNTFGQLCYRNTFKTYCLDNKLGSTCYYNTFVNGCCTNTFGSNCIRMFVKNLTNKNLINITSIQRQEYTITFEKNSNKQYVYWYLDSSNNPVYTLIP